VDYVVATRSRRSLRQDDDDRWFSSILGGKLKSGSPSIRSRTYVVVYSTVWCGQGKNKYMGSQRVEKPSGTLKNVRAGRASPHAYKQRENLLCYYSSRNVSFFITVIDIHSILVVKLTLTPSFNSNYAWVD
jgi:hypothetical protein